jgi:hypothetical protein
MIPSVGRIVHYTLNENDADQINKRRADAVGSGVAKDESGAIVHVGNKVQAGDVYPLVITRTWGDKEGSAVNGQVLLDGNDTFWATSRTEGEGQGVWSVPPRV